MRASTSALRTISMAASQRTKNTKENLAHRLQNLAQQLRLSSSISDDDDPVVDDRGKVFAPVAVPESAAKAAPELRRSTEGSLARRAAVLVCLFEGDCGEFRVILTKRASNLSSHSGEVSLPGGKAEDGDADDRETALREAKEEIGLVSSLVKIVAVMEPLISKHLLRVVPVIGILPNKQAFQPVPNATEVADIFDAPLEMFLKDENRRSTERELMGVKTLIHFFDYKVADKKFVIWGLTAAILIRAASVVYQRSPSFVEQFSR